MGQFRPEKFFDSTSYIAKIKDNRDEQERQLLRMREENESWEMHRVQVSARRCESRRASYDSHFTFGRRLLVSDRYTEQGISYGRTEYSAGTLLWGLCQHSCRLLISIQRRSLRGRFSPADQLKPSSVDNNMTALR